MFVTKAIKVLWEKFSKDIETINTTLDEKANSEDLSNEINLREQGDSLLKNTTDIIQGDVGGLKMATNSLISSVDTINSTLNTKANFDDLQALYQGVRVEYRNADATTLSNAKAYTDAQVSKIDTSTYATKADVTLSLDEAKAYTNQAIGGITEFDLVVVDELPVIGIKGVMYLVPKENGSGSDYSNEYVWVETRYEFVGTTQVDLSNYYTKDEVNIISSSDRAYTDGKVADKVTLSDFQGLGNYVTQIDNRKLEKPSGVESISIVTELPTSPQSNVLYFVKE